MSGVRGGMVRGALLASVCLSACAAPLSAEEQRDKVAGGSASDLAYVVRLNWPETFCTGAYIGERYILTAAHCIPEQDVALVSTHGADGRLVQAVASRALPHAEWSNDVANLGCEEGELRPPGLSLDLALLRMDDDFRDSETSEVIAVEPAPIALLPPEAQTTATVLGWGGSGEPAAPRQRLRAPATVLRSGPRWLDYRGDGGAGVCRGDSGGPLVNESGVIGVHSNFERFGDESCSTANIKGISVASFADWIESAKATLAAESFEPSFQSCLGRQGLRQWAAPDVNAQLDPSRRAEWNLPMSLGAKGRATDLTVEVGYESAHSDPLNVTLVGKAPTSTEPLFELELASSSTMPGLFRAVIDLDAELPLELVLVLRVAPDTQATIRELSATLQSDPHATAR